MTIKTNRPSSNRTVPEKAKKAKSNMKSEDAKLWEIFFFPDLHHMAIETLQQKKRVAERSTQGHGRRRRNWGGGRGERESTSGGGEMQRRAMCDVRCAMWAKQGDMALDCDRQMDLMEQSARWSLATNLLCVLLRLPGKGRIQHGGHRTGPQQTLAGSLLTRPRLFTAFLFFFSPSYPVCRPEIQIVSFLFPPPPVSTWKQIYKTLSPPSVRDSILIFLLTNKQYSIATAPPPPPLCLLFQPYE